MSDLIKALRKLHEHYQETTGGNKLTIYAEAADALEATTARADALLPYAQHHPWCKSKLPDVCDCGLTALLKEHV